MVRLLKRPYSGGKQLAWLFFSALVFTVLFTLPTWADVAGVPLHGFADAGWAMSTPGQPPREYTHGFVTGTLDLYLTPQFSDNVKSLMEIALEPGLDAESYGLDVERIQVGYTFSDAFNAWVGRFHTPYGYWNTAYHHGAEIQTSIYKPRFIDWEDHAGFMPSHSVGLWLNGKIPAGRGKIVWDAYIANGSRNLSGSLDMNILRDDNTNAGVGGRLAYQFGRSLHGLMVGLHALDEEVDSYASGPPTIGTSPSAAALMKFYGGFAVYENNGVEASTELYSFHDQNLQLPGSPSHTSAAGFVHVGYYFLPDLIPYARWERTKLDQTDPYFNTQINGFSYTRYLLGIRYNISGRSCIKLEVNRTKIEDSVTNLFGAPANYAMTPVSYSEVRTQYAIAF
jgi:hypothetical protein